MRTDADALIVTSTCPPPRCEESDHTTLTWDFPASVILQDQRRTLKFILKSDGAPAPSIPRQPSDSAKDRPSVGAAENGRQHSAQGSPG